MNKTAVVQAIVEALQAEFETLRQTSQKTRAAGNDAESKAEGKYDTRSTEDNYLADGLARQAHAVAQAAAAYENLPGREFGADSRIDLGALVQIEFAAETVWFFIGPSGGGTEVVCEGIAITVLTPDSPLGKQLLGLKAGSRIAAPKAQVRAVE